MIIWQIQVNGRLRPYTNSDPIPTRTPDQLGHYTSIRLGCFSVALCMVQNFLYSSGLTPKLVQQILAPIKKRVHNGAVKSRGQFNYNLRTLLVVTFYTLPLSNRIRLIQHPLFTAQVRVVQLF